MANARLRRNVSHNNPTIAVNGRPIYIINNNRNLLNMDQEDIGQFRRALPQFLAVSIKNILLFVYGMTLGFPTIVIPAIQGGDGREPSDIVLNREEISWFSSINLICVPLGCLFSGLLAQPIGKRRAMQFVNLPILASWLLFHFSTKTEHLYAALCFSGLGGGLMEAPVLTYVAEITEPKYRGILSALGSTCVITGVFIQFIMGSLMDWRTVAAVSSAFPVVSIIALCFVPESPTWLIREQRYKEAVKALQWLRGWVPEYKIESEFNQLYHELVTQPALDEAEEADDKPSKCKHHLRMFQKRSVFVPFLLVTFTFFTGHFSGKTSLQTYAVQIFHTLKAPINKYHATILLGAAEMVATIMCVFLIHFTGKRPLVMISTIGVGICFFATATYAHYLKIVPGFAINNVVVNASSIVPKEDIISQKNITDIFLSEQNALLHAAENGSVFMNIKNFENFETTVLPTISTEDDSDLGYALNRSSRDIQLIDSDNTSKTDYDEPINLWNTTSFDYAELNDTDTAYSEAVIPTMHFPDSKEVILNSEKIRASNKSNTSDDIVEHQAADSGIKPGDNVGHDLLLKVPKQEENYLVWLPLILLLGSAFFAHLGIRMIPWILIGEVFPAQVRSTASGAVSAVGYIFGFLANKLFLQMLSTLTLPGTFWFYSAVAFFGAIVLYFTLPETEGRSLSEIEAHFSKKSTFNLLTKSAISDKTNKPCIQLDNLNNLHTPIDSVNEAKIVQLQQSFVQPNTTSTGKINTAYEENNTTYL